jgi:hypothetical protein
MSHEDRRRSDARSGLSPDVPGYALYQAAAELAGVAPIAERLARSFAHLNRFQVSARRLSRPWQREYAAVREAMRAASARREKLEEAHVLELGRRIFALLWHVTSQRRRAG